MGTGRVRDWWSAASRAEFEKRTAGLVDQFSQYEPVPGAKINGRQNLGENIGDLGGLSVAYAAYRKYVDDKQGGKAPVIDGFTGDQRFFMSWAQLWRSLVTESENGGGCCPIPIARVSSGSTASCATSMPGMTPLA